jgi:hypothetical protein
MALLGSGAEEASVDAPSRPRGAFGDCRRSRVRGSSRLEGSVDDAEDQADRAHHPQGPGQARHAEHHDADDDDETIH